MNVFLSEIPTFIDELGALSVVDGIIPFPVKRLFWIYGADGQIRGGHRHHETRQALVALSGTVTIYINDGVDEVQIKLTRPDQYLIIEPKDWHTMRFEQSAILLVLASTNYDINDYIDEQY